MSAEAARGGTPSLPKNLEGITNVVALYNPASTHAEASAGLITLLRRTVAHYNLEVTEHETSPHQNENDEMVSELAKPGETIVAIAGGDGTISDIGNSLLRTEIDDPVLVLPCGNANDIAAQVYGNEAEQGHPSTLITGSARRIHPLEVTVYDGDRQSVQFLRYALAYAGIGAAGQTAHRLNDEAFRQHWLHDKTIGSWQWGTSLLEKTTALRALATSRKFRDTDHDERINELMFANGNQMAKDFHLQGDLFKDKQFMYLSSGQFSRLRLLAGFMLGSEQGKSFRKYETDLHCTAGTFMHIDGEDYALGGDLHLTVARSARSLQMLTHGNLP